MTQRLDLLAHPWWVNLLTLVPIAAFWYWRKTGVRVPLAKLGLITAWSAAFGFVEATVVVYLRALVGASFGYESTLSGVARFSVQVVDKPMIAVPRDLLLLETSREAATIVMLLALAMLVAGTWRERSACFLCAFAVWDICYYLALHLTIQWPPSLTTVDVLFLIPEPWIAQVWFPLLLSSLTLIAILLLRPRRTSIPSPP